MSEIELKSVHLFVRIFPRDFSVIIGNLLFLLYLELYFRTSFSSDGDVFEAPNQGAKFSYNA